MRVWDIVKSIISPQEAASTPSVSAPPDHRTKKEIAKKAAGENYKAGRSFYSEVVVEDLPIFTRQYVHYMLADTSVGLGLRIRNAILSGVELEVEGDKEVVEYIKKLWKKLWGHYSHRLLETKQWGYAGWTIDYSLDADGFLCVEELKGYRYSDVKPLVSRGKVVGFRITRTDEKVLAPNALWTTFDAKHGNHGGDSILRRAYPEWYEKGMAGASKKTLQLRMLKDAYRGEVIWYPENEKIEYTDDEGNNVQVASRDIARELIENSTNGTGYALDSSLRPDGSKKWDIQHPWDGRDPKAVFEWLNSNDEGILKALDVLPEVVKAAETGSGFSGRSVPLMITVNACQVEAQELLQSIDAMVFRPCVQICFGGDAEYSIGLKSLIDTLSDDVGGSSMGGGAIGGGPNAGPNQPAGGMPMNQPGQPGGVRQSNAQFAEDQHEFSSTQFDLPWEISNLIREFAMETIDPADLAEDGFENQPHITVKYGLHIDDPKPLDSLLQSQGPIAVRIGKLSYFSGSEYDVLIFDVESDGLRELNRKIASAIPCTDTHPVYHPHVTVAYLNPGAAVNYLNVNNYIEGMSIVFDYLTFSNKYRDRFSIHLDGSVQFDESSRSPRDSTNPIADEIIERASAE